MKTFKDFYDNKLSINEDAMQIMQQAADLIKQNPQAAQVLAYSLGVGIAGKTANVIWDYFQNKSNQKPQQPQQQQPQQQQPQQQQNFQR